MCRHLLRARRELQGVQIAKARARLPQGYFRRRCKAVVVAALLPVAGLGVWCHKSNVFATCRAAAAGGAQAQAAEGRQGLRTPGRVPGAWLATLRLCFQPCSRPAVCAAPCIRHTTHRHSLWCKLHQDVCQVRAAQHCTWRIKPCSCPAMYAAPCVRHIMHTQHGEGLSVSPAAWASFQLAA